MDLVLKKGSSLFFNHSIVIGGQKLLQNHFLAQNLQAINDGSIAHVRCIRKLILICCPQRPEMIVRLNGRNYSSGAVNKIGCPPFDACRIEGALQYVCIKLISIHQEKGF